MGSILRILYLENDLADAELVRDTLELEGIACDVTRVETESGFVTSLQQGTFDLILADYTLPSFDGLSALKVARQQRPDLPFIFVSGTLGEEVAIEALKIGATDYVLKTGLLRLVPSVRRAQREAEERERLRQLEANLAHINRVSMMGELAASLGHEIKQPLAAAITNANACLLWLKREHPDLEEAREAASGMIEDVMRSVEIINRTSALYRKSTPEHALVNLNKVIDEIIALLRPEAVRAGVQIRSALAADLPTIMGDRVQLQQVVMNLMMNSIDALRGVDGLREINIVSRRDDGDQAFVAVSDTGVGLPPEKDEIFDAFFTTKPAGTGMGLAISRSIIESHGGRLSAGSNSGRGATFSFTLPTALERDRDS